jgi:hypothetical protein
LNNRQCDDWQKGLKPMTFYNNTFDTSIQCEESNEVSPEEYAEVMALMAEDSEPQDFEGYSEWSESLEKDYLGGYSTSTEGASYNGVDI